MRSMSPVDDAQLVDALTRHLDTEGVDTELGAPFDDLVAGLVSGTLLDDERERALELLAQHPSLRDVLARVEAAEPQEAPAADDVAHVVPRRTNWMPVVAAAAAILLAFGLFRWLGDDPAAPADPATRLATLANELRAEAPDVFGSFAPVAAADRVPRQTDVQRGGLQLGAPVAAVLDPRPTLQWAGLTDDTRARVTVRDEDGALHLDTTQVGQTLAWPDEAKPLAPGTTYVWRVTADGDVQRTGSRAFRVLSEKDATRYRDGVRRIEGHAADDAALLAAQWALTFDLEAEARRHLAQAPAGAEVDALRAWLDPAR